MADLAEDLASLRSLSLCGVSIQELFLTADSAQDRLSTVEFLKSVRSLGHPLQKTIIESDESNAEEDFNFYRAHDL